MRDQLGSWTPGNWAPDEISSWTPSVTDQIKAFLADNLYGGGREGYRRAGGLTEGISLLGVPGAAMDAGDAAGAFGKGNFVEGGILSAATLASLVPVAGRPVSKALRSLAGEVSEKVVRPGIKAYHGSPHDFDKFDLSNIGKGEGAQAEGFGLYFGENPKVADYYRDSVSGNAPDFNDMVKIGGGGQGSHEFSLDMINDMGLEPPYPKDAKFYDAWRDKVQKYVRAAEDYGDYSASERSFRDVVDYAETNAMAGAGTRYKVNIDADPNDFLTDGAELSKLSPEIQKKLKENGITTTAEMWKATFTPDGARTLSDAGIPGVRYLDQGSRGAGEGTSNYVVFDAALIEILKKYGLTGLLAGGGATYLATQPGGDPQSGLLAPDL
jgi:hypothetical protein